MKFLHTFLLTFLGVLNVTFAQTNSDTCEPSVSRKPGTKNVFELLGHGYCREANRSGKGKKYAEIILDDIADCLRVCDEDSDCVAFEWFLRPHQIGFICELHNSTSGIAAFGGLMISSLTDATSCWVKRPRRNTVIPNEQDKNCHFLLLGPGACYSDDSILSRDIDFEQNDILEVQLCQEKCLSNPQCSGFEFSIEDKCRLFLSSRDPSLGFQIFNPNQKRSKRCFLKSCIDQDLGIPEGWICNPRFYNGNDGCDCNCGVYDPDCDKSDQNSRIFGCKQGQTCSDEGQCQYSKWSCEESLFNNSDGCHCKCGAYDPDCANTGQCVDLPGCDGSHTSAECGGYLFDKVHSFNETCIDLSESDFSAGYIPKDVGLWGALTKLKVYSNALKGSIAAGIGQLDSLENLFLYSDALTGSIPKQIGQLQRLKELHLYIPGVKGQIPSQLGTLTRLKKLYLHSSVTGTIPRQIGNLKKLTELYLGSKSLKGAVPKQIGRLSSLRLFELSDTSLTSLPEEIKYLSTVERLTLSKNKEMITRLPSQIGSMISLNFLNLHENSFFGYIPSELGNLLELTHLTLAENFNGTFPAQIGKLTKLKALNFYGTSVTSLPTTIGLMKNLVNLNGFFNKLENFPGQIAELSLLKRLDLRSNQISATIPSEINNLKELTHLHLGNNKIYGNIPLQLGEITRLTGLWLQNNFLQGVIPSQLGNLKILRSLHLNDNSLSGTISEELSRFPSIKRLHLHSNQLSLTSSTTVLSDLPPNVELFLRNNTALSCQKSLLEWYPEFSVNVSDREQILCEPNNAYGELDLSPHVLRVDPEAPGNSAERVRSESTTFNEINLFWDYDKSEFGALEIKSSPDECRSDRCKFDLATHVRKITSRHYSCDSKSLSKIQPFYDNNENRFVELIISGFEISWSASRRDQVDDKKTIKSRTCMIASQLNDTPGLKMYNITINSHIRPNTEYEVMVTPFNIFLGANPFRRVSGIPSKKLYVTTKEHIPDSPPTNVRVLSRSHNSVNLQWDEIPERQANGIITEFQVRYFDNKDEIAVTDKSIITDLSPNTEYVVEVRARTKVGWCQNWTNSSIITTCIPNTIGELNGECVANTGFFKIDDYSVESCEDYPFQLNQSACLRTKRVQDLMLNKGWWRPNINVISSVDLRVCMNSRFCEHQSNASKLFSDSDRHCSLHHTGVLCSDCVEGYEMSNLNGCVTCTEEDHEAHKAKVISVVVICVVIILAWLCLLIYFTGIFGKKKSNSTRRIKWNRFVSFLEIIIGTKLRILFGFFQVFYSIERTISTRIPSDSGADWMKVITLSIASFDLGFLVEFIEVHCYASISHYKSLLVYTILPLCTLLLFALVYQLLKKAYPDFKDKLRQEFFWTFFLLTFLIYPGVSQKILETYLCDKFNFPEGEKEFLVADYRESCEPSETRIFWLFYASLCLLIYPIGILFLYVWFLHNCREIINKRRKTVKEKKKLRRIEGLTKPYKKKWYWFEAYELVRKFVLTSVVAILGLQTDNKEQIATGALVFCIVALCIVIHLNPYKYVGDFCFATLSLILLCMTTQIHGLSSAKHMNSDAQAKTEFEESRYNLLLGLECVAFFLIVIVEFVFFRPELDQRHNETQKQDQSTSDHMLLSERNENSMLDIFQKTCHDETKAMIDKLKSENTELRSKLDQETHTAVESSAVLSPA